MVLLPLHMSSLKAWNASCRSNFSRRRLNFLFPAYSREPLSTHCLPRKPRPDCWRNPSVFPSLSRLLDWIPGQHHVPSFGFPRDFNRAMSNSNSASLLALQSWCGALTVGKTPYPQFVLFGDSITQQAFDQTHGFAAAAQLANGR